MVEECARDTHALTFATRKFMRIASTFIRHTDFAVEHFEQRAFPTAHTPNDVNEIRFVYAEVYVVQNRTSVNKYFCVVKVYEHAEDL